MTEMPPNENVQETQTPSEQPADQTVEVNGKSVTIDELKSGYMRNDKFTQSQQALAERERAIEQYQPFINAIESDEGYQQAIESATNTYFAGQQQESAPQQTDPKVQEAFNVINQQQEELAMVQLKMEINDLKAQHEDFDQDAVLTTARELGVTDLNQAYRVWKAENHDPMQAKLEVVKDMQKSKEAALPDTNSAPAAEGENSPGGWHSTLNAAKARLGSGQ